MADKTASDGGNGTLKSAAAFAMPYLERFMREHIAPFVTNSAVFERIKTAFDHEAVVAAGAAIPGVMSLLASKIPDSAFIFPEIADTIRDSIVIFFSEVGKVLSGDVTPTPEKMKEAAEAGLKAVTDYFDQDVFYDRAGHWHLAACPNWQGGRQPAKAKLRDVLEQHRLGGACCQKHIQDVVAAKAAEAVKTVEAPKSQTDATKLPDGASVMDVLGALLRSSDEETRKVGQRLSAWMRSLSKEQFKEAEVLMEGSFDTLNEAFALDSAETTEDKMDFLTAMKGRKEAKKSKLREARDELKADAINLFTISMSGFHALDKGIVSDDELTKQRAEVAKLKTAKDARRNRKPGFMNLWGLL